MTATDFKISDDFPPVDYATWKQAVEADLSGVPFQRKLVSHTYEGIDIQPVYTLADQLPGLNPTGFPGAVPFVRGSHRLGHVLNGVDLRQEHAHPDLLTSNRCILDDLRGGATSLQLRLDRATRWGCDVSDDEVGDAVGDDGLMVYSAGDLESLLAGVHLDLIDVALEPGGAFIPAAATLISLWKRRGVSPNDARGAFNADPLKMLAAEGRLPVAAERSLQDMAALAVWTHQTYPQVTSVSVDTSPYHDSGATAAQDIAMAAATAVQYLRSMTAAGLSVDEAAGQMLFRVSLGTHHFLAIAKLRALRRVGSRILQASGGTASGIRVHARTGRRVMTQRDPYVNLLRNSVSVFSALIGGVDAITSLPFDHAAGLPDDFSRRIARNTVSILQEESHLHRVMDPAGGSWFLEKLTDEVSQKAWTIFQEIENNGGMLASLNSGWVAEQIDTAFAPRVKDIARRKEGITGVSEFPNLQEEAVSHPQPDIAALRAAARAKHQPPPHSEAPNATTEDKPSPGGTIERRGDWISQCVSLADSDMTMGTIGKALGFRSSTTTVQPIEAHAFAQPFEELRDASDAWSRLTGGRPQIFSANLGPVAHFNARASYAKNFFEAGGFEVLENDGFPDAASVADAFARSQADMAVICSSDKLYAELVIPVASALKAAGADRVILAGHPGENEAAWTAAGVDEFIYIKCDVLDTLRRLLRHKKVLAS